MSLKNGEIQAVSGLLAAAITAALVAGSVYLQGGEPDEICDDTQAADEDKDGYVNCEDDDCKQLPLCEDKRLVIDAELAYKAEPEQKQPQKQFKDKEQEIEEGVSRDDQAKARDEKACTTDADCDAKQQCIKNVCERRKNTTTAETSPTGIIPDRTNVDDVPSGNSTPMLGAFDGSKHGRGPVNKGDPYFGALKADLVFAPPELARTDAGPTPEGCIHIEPDGKISETKFRRRSNDDLMPLAEKSLAELQKKRNDDPKPVPTHLLEDLTTTWICFNFTADGAK